MVTQWQDWMQLCRLLHSTSTQVLHVPEHTLQHMGQHVLPVGSLMPLKHALRNLPHVAESGFLCLLCRRRMHHKICHWNLIVKSLYTECDHVKMSLFFSFSWSHMKLCFCLLFVPHVPCHTSNRILKCFANRHTIYRVGNHFFFLLWAYFLCRLGLIGSWNKLQCL